MLALFMKSFALVVFQITTVASISSCLVLVIAKIIFQNGNYSWCFLEVYSEPSPKLKQII